jgi:hypothetical protein
VYQPRKRREEKKSFSFFFFFYLKKEIKKKKKKLREGVSLRAGQVGKITASFSLVGLLAS